VKSAGLRDFPDFWTMADMAMIVAAGAYVMRSTSS
jgi:hypothetical protein